MPKIHDTGPHRLGNEPLVEFERLTIGCSEVPGYAFVQFPDYVIAILERSQIEALIEGLQKQIEAMDKQPKGTA